MSKNDIRWQQRFSNFLKAFKQLQKAVDLQNERDLTDLEKQGLIQAFEFTHELVCNVIKDFFDYQGNNTIAGSRDATREAFTIGLISDGAGWMEMIKSRNLSSHTYNEDTADEIALKIRSYSELFSEFKTSMEKRIEI
jgi:nucleotidyltransferase substrate binding protein (TIGR01987 family)